MHFIILLCLTIAFAFAANPECRWACDDPVCPAHCVPVCAAPRCQIQCDPGHSCPFSVPSCTTRCPLDQSPADNCPQCETVCSPVNCPGCHPLCEATVCNWHCTKPAMCVQPRCELVCERPACEGNVTSESPRLRAGWTFVLCVGVVMLIL